MPQVNSRVATIALVCSRKSCRIATPAVITLSLILIIHLGTNDLALTTDLVANISSIVLAETTIAFVYPVKIGQISAGRDPVKKLVVNLIMQRRERTSRPEHMPCACLAAGARNSRRVSR
jgi:hypothetical protein